MITKRKIKFQAKANLIKININTEYIKKYLCVWKYFQNITVIKNI